MPHNFIKPFFIRVFANVSRKYFGKLREFLGICGRKRQGLALRARRREKIKPRSFARLSISVAERV
jgi:hypothetical protein